MVTHLKEAYTRLEERIATWAGYEPEQVVACSSGTAALHLAFESIGMRPGELVAVPDFAMIACARAVSMAGLVPMFVPCSDDDLLLDVDSLCGMLTTARLLPGQRVEGSVGAVLAVHTYGRRCDMDGVMGTAAAHGLMVVEDLAEAHGVGPDAVSDAACWSFYKNKIVAGEEGGAVAFRRTSHAATARKLRCLGFLPGHDFTHIPRGCNYRLANTLASLVLRSFERIGPNLRDRRVIEGWYDGRCPYDLRMPRRDVPWVYDLRVRGMTPMQQRKVIASLIDAGIAARHGFKPLSAQTEWYNGNVPDSSVAQGREVIYLPIRPGVTTRSEVDAAFEVIESCVGQF